jgi:prolyl oligopeptidase
MARAAVTRRRAPPRFVPGAGAMRLAAAALVAAALAPPLNAASFAGIDIPAPRPARPVVDTYWGVDVEDPYRFLEDTSDPQVQQWMRAQADATAALLSRIPGRAALRARLDEIDAAAPAAIGDIARDDDGRLFYLKRAAGENQFGLYRRDAPDAEEVLLVDVGALARSAGRPHAIGSFAPSPDGRHVAYTLSAAGSEIGTLHVIDAATGRPVLAPIDRVRSGAIAWLPDGSGFFHARLAPDYERRPRGERFMDARTWLRPLAATETERAVFGPGVHADVPLGRSDSGYVVPVRGHDLALALVFHGVQREISLYRAPLSAVLAGKARWRKVFDAAAGVQQVAQADGFLYLRTAKDAPRFRVLRVPIGATDLANPEVVVPAGDGIVTGIVAARDALYVTRRHGVVERLLRIAHPGPPRSVPVALPVEGAVRFVHASPRHDGALVALSSWTRVTRTYAIDARSDATPLVLAPPGRFDAPDGIEAREVKVASHDGTEVPVSIVMARGTRQDGKNPLLLHGYGAYGSVEEPAFSPRLLAWLERGGIYVNAHVRGGGILGDAWRRAGWKATKPNTWKDGIAVAEWLIANGYTSRERLAVIGGSAGGIFAGRAITERPDLFAAAVIAVGNVDSLRSESRANGAANIPEYGTVTREDEFRALLAMSPYANVRPGTPYPAVLLEHGVNDSRVDVWMPLKLASRLAGASTSGRPVLLRLEYDAGHGAGGTREAALERLADRWSFLLWQAGDPAFRPLAPTAPVEAPR